ncbi:MAG: 2-oxo acid dehydrogenase subunit E2 [Microbacteriaceae bacterium]|jgi:pyruvate dehydrogenase E2 component (dihydrolipoamide acetyltransferase)|nr:2-oxo acid dehydrogenase subunit E2 [Microbacteriaceae bacterium]MBT5730285.1 2-oxo acid dehydrogenase subunit E2 [Microbacteriaceae bacterium]
MAIIIRMPEVLAGASEAVLSNWLVTEGAEIAVGDVLAEIETEKATVEYQAEEAGIVAKMLIKPGDLADVGTPIAIFTAAGEGEAEIAQALADAGAASADTAAPASVEESAAASAPPAPSEPVAAPAVDTQAPPAPAGGRLFVSPLVRKMAREHGVDLTRITGTGPDGRIVRADFEAYVASGAPVAASSAAPATPVAHAAAGVLEIPHTGMRKAIARRLTESKSTVPHFYLSADCRVEKLLAARKDVNDAKGVKISVNDWVVKAVALALMDVPDANVIWGDSAMSKFDSADIAVAVATEGGLLTPVIRGVEKLSLIELNAAIADAASRARSGKIKQEEIEGGSFAVTNLGMYGTREFSAIINPPQSGILAVGAATAAPVVENGEVVAGMVMTVTLSADHRAVDGALAAQWLAAFQRHIENPLGMLI